MLSMTNASDFSDSSSSQRLGHPSGSKEISFQLTATSQLPAVDKRSPTSHLQQTEETAAHRTAQRTAVLAASQDQHALRDVLGDALGGGTAASLGGTARTSAKRTASPGSIPVLNQSTSEVTKALAKRTAQRSAGGLAASQDQHALRDVLGDALGLDSGPSGRRPSRLSETEASTATRMQHSQSTVKEATTLTEEVPGDPGGIFMDQVSPGWKVSSRTSAASAPRKDVPRAPSSSSSEAKGESTTRRPPSRSEVHVVTEDANPTASRRGEGRAPSLRAAGELHVAKTAAVKGAHGAQVSHRRNDRPSSQPGAGFDADRSVTWPQSNMPPLQIFASQKTGSDRSSSRPAGRPSTPESARLAKVEKDRARDTKRTGGLSIPFHDQPPGAPAPQPPKAVQERFSQHERQRREKIAELKAQTAPAR